MGEDLTEDRKEEGGRGLPFPPDVLFGPPARGASQSWAVTSCCLSFLLGFQKEIQFFSLPVMQNGFPRQCGQWIIPRSPSGGSLAGVCPCLYSVY